MSSSDAAGIGDRVSDLEIAGAWVVDPTTGREGPADLAVEDGVLARLDWHEPTGATVGTGIVVAPGLVDLHAHFREPGFEDAETVATGQLAAGHGGFSTVCLMPNTDPPVDEAPVLATVLGRAFESGSPVRVLAWGAATRGRAGAELASLGELADGGALGFSDDGNPIESGVLFRNALVYAAMLGRILVDHPEDRALTKGAEANEGLVATVLGLRGWPAAGEEAAVARDLAILADVVAADAPGARLHLTHLSTAGSIELVRRAKGARLPVTCDVTPHHMALTDEWLAGARRFAWGSGRGNPWEDGAIVALPFATSLRVNPPLRTRSDALALLAGLRDGTVDAIATDHAPHTQVDKEVEFGFAATGISGMETALGLALAAVEAGQLALVRAVEALTTGPARVLGDVPMAATGRPVAPGLVVGQAADLVVLDRADGWEVSARSLRSLGKNSPLLGMRLPGRVLATVAGGRLAWLDDEA